MQSNLRHLFHIILLAVFLLSTPFCLAQDRSTNEQKIPKDSQHNVRKHLPIDKLNDITDSIKQQNKTVDAKLILLKKAKTENDKRAIQTEIDTLNHLISQQETSFEMILTTGLLLTNVEPEQETPFDWQKDLLEILQPIMNELHELTAFKRELNSLQQKVAFYQSRINDINKALTHIKQTNTTELKPIALARFKQIQQKWQSQLKESNHLLEVAQLQFDEMSQSQIAETTFSDQVKQFTTGRGTTIILAVAAFLLVYFAMKLFWKWFIWIRGQNKNSKQTYLQRVTALIYHIAIGILSIMAIFYVLSIRNDQVLIGILVLLLIIIFWALKNSIPRYVAEIQTFLNAGPVREDERIIYNGIPMKVGALHFYTELTNPALPSTALRLPLSDLLDYVSRQYTEDEPWFPCRQGDFVLLSDETYGMVKCITLENVLLSLSNGMMPKTYAISDFLAASPKNLSQGFLVTSDFGIAYKYQPNSTTQIPEIFRTGIQQGLQKETYGQSLVDLSVYFSQANASSLDYKIIAKFDGQAAGDYYPIIRALQRYAVEVCNQQQWEIPFAQLEIHHNPD